jgi:hypothetical protein
MEDGVGAAQSDPHAMLLNSLNCANANTASWLAPLGEALSAHAQQCPTATPLARHFHALLSPASEGKGGPAAAAALAVSISRALSARVACSPAACVLSPLLLHGAADTLSGLPRAPSDPRPPRLRLPHLPPTPPFPQPAPNGRAATAPAPPRAPAPPPPEVLLGGVGGGGGIAGGAAGRGAAWAPPATGAAATAPVAGVHSSKRTPAGALPEAWEHFSVEGPFNLVYAESGFPPAHRGALYAVIVAALGAAAGRAAWSGSFAIAAAGLSTRRDFGDIDISYPGSGRDPTTCATLRKLLTAVRGAVATSGGSLTAGAVVTGARFIATSPVSPLGAAGSGSYTNVPIDFMDASGTKVKTCLLQFSERDPRWAPRALVGTYWALPLMEVWITAQRRGAGRGGADSMDLVGARPLPGAPTFVNPRTILLACSGRTGAEGYADLAALPVPDTAAIVGQFLDAVERLLQNPLAFPGLIERHPAWDATWPRGAAASGPAAPFQRERTAWAAEKDAQNEALVAVMPSLSALANSSHAVRLTSALGVAATVLRRVVWRFPRDTVKSGALYSLSASRAALITWLMAPAVAATTPWGIVGCREICALLQGHDGGAGGEGANGEPSDAEDWNAALPGGVPRQRLEAGLQAARAAGHLPPGGAKVERRARRAAAVATHARAARLVATFGGGAELARAQVGRRGLVAQLVQCLLFRHRGPRPDHNAVLAALRPGLLHAAAAPSLHPGTSAVLAALASGVDFVGMGGCAATQTEVEAIFCLVARAALGSEVKIVTSLEAMEEELHAKRNARASAPGWLSLLSEGSGAYAAFSARRDLGREGGLGGGSGPHAPPPPAAPAPAPAPPPPPPTTPAPAPANGAAQTQAPHGPGPTPNPAPAYATPPSPAEALATVQRPHAPAPPPNAVPGVHAEVAPLPHQPTHAYTAPAPAQAPAPTTTPSPAPAPAPTPSINFLVPARAPSPLLPGLHTAAPKAPTALPTHPLAPPPLQPAESASPPLQAAAIASGRGGARGGGRGGAQRGRRGASERASSEKGVGGGGGGGASGGEGKGGGPRGTPPPPPPGPPRANAPGKGGGTPNAVVKVRVEGTLGKPEHGELLRQHSADLSCVAPLAADLVNLILLWACEQRGGAWPPLCLKKGGATMDSAAITLWRHALTVGRKSTRDGTAAMSRPSGHEGGVVTSQRSIRERKKSVKAAEADAMEGAESVSGSNASWEDLEGENTASDATDSESDETVSTCDNLLATALRHLGSPTRVDRRRGDSLLLQAQAGHMSAMFALQCSGNSLHGVPAKLKSNLRAAFLRIASAQMRNGGADAAFWAAQLKKPAKVVAHLRMVVMGITFFPAGEGAPRRNVVAPAEAEKALQDPLVLSLLDLYKRTLYHGEKPDGSIILEAGSNEEWQGNTVEGTWGRFSRYLEHHPRRTVFFVYTLLRQREKWIEELPKNKAPPGQDNSLAEISGFHPNAPINLEEENEDAGSVASGDDSDAGEDEEEAAAQVGYRGKKWYPRLIALVPRAKPVRRSVQLNDFSSRSIFGVALGEVLTNPPKLPPGAVYGSSVSTNGFNASFPYTKKPVGGRGPAAAGRPSKAAARAPTGSGAAVLGGGGGHAPPPTLAGCSRVCAVDAGNVVISRVFERVVDPISGMVRGRTWQLSNVEWRAARGDDARLAKTRGWCVALRQPGGAFAKLATVCRTTSSSDAFTDFCRVAHGTLGVPGAYAAVLEERLKP